MPKAYRTTISHVSSGYKKSFVTILFLLCGVAYSFSQVKINEVFINPQQDAADPLYQSLGYCSDETFGYEWIEIYNASQCDTIALDCYILSSMTSGANEGSFAFPAGTKISPLDFILVGGPNVPGVQYKIFDYCNFDHYCGSGNWSLDNTFGWVALYEPNGNVADAVFWTENSGQGNSLVTNSAYDNVPCVPQICSTPSLKSPKQMTPGSEILYAGRTPTVGRSIYRINDGTGAWQTDAIPTPDNCNGPCAPRSDLNIQIMFSGNEHCEGADGFVIANVTGGVFPYSLDWSDGTANTDSIGGLIQGTYTVTAIDNDGCQFSASTTLINIGTPVEVVIQPKDTAIFKGESIQLNLVTISNLTTISWQPGIGLSCLNCIDPISNPTQTTNYIVSVVDVDGCTGTAEGIVRIIPDENSVFIPTAFTPGEPGLNSILYVQSPKIQSLEFHIFDRWGKEVFVSNDKSKGWDGRDKNGQELSAGVYVYYVVVLFVNGKERTVKGNVALLR